MLRNVVRADREFDDPLPEAKDLDGVINVLFYHDTYWAGPAMCAISPRPPGRRPSSLKQPETRQRLAANVFRRVALGEHPAVLLARSRHQRETHLVGP